ncbi:unnamed protein product [Pipistrellus nathusii]|uniref:Uncharacterized protein n=1 Tax=Pipistrellus nathusii TaxID=59473 RepID=A0ABN9ZZ04_PIPNA
MGFGGGRGAAPAGLNRGGVLGPSGLHKKGSRLPCCEWHSSHSHAASHTAWEAHRGQRHWLRRCHGLYCVSNDKLLNGLVLGHVLGAGGAMNRLHMASAFFGTTVIPSFLGHLGNEDPRELEDF